MNKRLYCTFTNTDEVENVLSKIQSSYTILFDKIFILENLEEGMAVTYGFSL